MDTRARTWEPRRSVAVARWLTRQDFPAVEPIEVSQPVAVDGTAVTFWRYYNQKDRPTPSAVFSAA
jgi:hypothetical protein